MLKKLTTPVILILLAAASWWYVRSLEKDLTTKSAAVTHGPDYFMFNAESTVMDKQGSPKHKLVTAYLAHYPDENRTELQQPHLTLHQQDGSLWSIKANSGTVYQQTEKISLSGNVIIEKPLSPDAPASTPALIKIETEKVHINPNRHIAETDEAVQITSKDGSVSAIGMKANLLNKTLELSSNVRGTYAPSR